jgi:hypothetical protein
MPLGFNWVGEKVTTKSMQLYTFRYTSIPMKITIVNNIKEELIVPYRQTTTYCHIITAVFQYMTQLFLCLFFSSPPGELGITVNLTLINRTLIRLVYWHCCTPQTIHIKE